MSTYNKPLQQISTGTANKISIHPQAFKGYCHSGQQQKEVFKILCHMHFLCLGPWKW